MPVFVPLEPPRELPTKGSAIERAVMDWKSKDTSTHFHKAKDVAAFANHLGGTIVVGAVEVTGHLQHYPGLTRDEAAKVRKHYSEAVTKRCEPHPCIDFSEYPCPDDTTKVVVAVNVWPSLLLVGVWVHAHKAAEDYEGRSFVFPVRAGTDADYLTPGQLAMYMTPQVRRMAVMLSRLPKGTRIGIHLANGASRTDALNEVREEENLVTFCAEGGGAQTTLHLPLDRITTVYQYWDTNRQQAMWMLHVALPV